MSAQQLQNSNECIYYHREYENDYKVKGDDHSYLSICKRVAIAALPYISLYTPLRPVLSLGLGVLRTVFCFNKSATKFQNGKYASSLNKLIIGIVAVYSVINIFFRSYFGMVATASSDLFQNFLKFVKKARNIKGFDATLFEAFISFVNTLNSLLYLGILVIPSYELILISILLQVAYELINSAKEFKNGKYIEGVSKLGMSGVRGYEALPYIQINYYIYKDKIDAMRCKVAAVFHKAASILALPCWRYSEKAVYLFTPISERVKDSNLLYVKEVSKRAFFALAALPIIPLTLGLAALELVPRTIANAIQPHSFFYLGGNGAEKRELGENVKVRTWNLCFVDGGFTYMFGGVPPWRQRVDAAVAAILENPADVECLQEINSVAAAYALYDGLKDHYPHFYFNVGSQTFTQNSGHMIISKFPLSDIEFTPFSTGTGSQSMVNKGLFSFSLSCNNEIFAKIFAAHLSPSKDDFAPSDFEIERRRKEFAMIHNKLLEIEKEEYLKIVLGDFNTVEGSDDYKKSLISSEHYYDPFKNKKADEKPLCATDEMIDAVFDNAKNEAKDPFRVDYALIYKNGYKGNLLDIKTDITKAFDTDNLENNPLSDHFGAVITIPV